VTNTGTLRPELTTSTGGARPTLEDAVNYTIRVHWLGTKNEGGALANAREWVDMLPTGIKLEEVDARLVSTAVLALKARGLSNATINRKLSALGRVLASAAGAGLLQGAPLRLPRLKEKGGRTRIVSEAELARLRALSLPICADLWAFLFDTGLRVGEALSLDQADVDVGSRSVVVRESKSGSPRTVPLTLRALEACGSGHRTPFALSHSQVNREWSGVRHAMGLTLDEQFVPHALRHTCATRLIKAGVSLPVVQRWLGHKNISVTMRYAHVGDREVNAAAACLEAKNS